MKVLISTSSFGKAIDTPLRICKEKCEVILNPYGRKLTTQEFIELSKDVEGVIAGVETITREALESRPNIRAISRCGVGMDSVDQDACHDLNIKLSNTPLAPVDSVAELTVTLILDLLKNVSNMNTSLKQGSWKKLPGVMLSEKKIGIIGLGRIGQKVAALLSGFGVEIAYTDIEEKESLYSYMRKEELLEWADIITIHTSTCEKDSYIIGENELEKMKKGAYLINTSRGKFIDEKALANALENGKLQGAALDVFSEEPYTGSLCQMDHVLLTPHISSSAKEGRVKMELEAVYNLFEGLGIQYDKSNNI